MSLKEIIKAAFSFALVGTGVQAVFGEGFKALKITATQFFAKEFAKYTILLGLAYITSKGDRDTTGRNLGIKRATTNPIAPRNIIYGKTRVGGTIVQRVVSSPTGKTNNAILHHVIAVAGHEINNITKVFIDAGKGTKELDLSDSNDFVSATENGATVFRCVDPNFVNVDNDDAYTDGSLIKLSFEKGDQTAANGYALAQMTNLDWTSDHKLLDIAYVYINCIYDREQFTAIPSLSFEIEGKKIFDPVTSTTAFSTNPALIIRDYLMDSTYGFGAVADEINDATTGAGFVKARSDCNDSVSITGGTESRYTLNGQFVSTEEPQQVLEHMLSACAGKLIYNNGKFSLIVGKERTASGTITDDKILAPAQIQTKASGLTSANGAKATYVRPTDKYIAGEITPYKDSTYLSEDTPTGKASADYENFLDLAFPFTHSSFTAQRMARIALDYQRQDQIINVIVPLDFLSHQVGDIINFDNERLGYSGKDFEIVSMSFEFLENQYLALSLSLKEYSTTIFDSISYVADPTLPSEPSGGDNSVSSPTGLTLTEFTKESQMRLHFIRAAWTNNSDEKIIATEVAYKKSTDSNFDSASVNYPSAFFSFYVEPATTYNVKVRHITASGVSSDFTGIVNITTSADRSTLTSGSIGGITIESGKLYQGTGTFNNSNTGFYIDNTGQFSLKDKLSFNGTTLSISGNLTVENTISADKIVVGGITLDNLISAADQASSNYLTTFSGAVKIASGGATAGYPAELQIQATEHTNAIGTLQQGQTQLTIRARNNTSNGAIAFQGFNGTTPTNYGNFDASGNLNLNQNLVVSGDLTVSGTTTTVDTTNTNVKDNNLTLNYSTGDSSSTANGAGITIQDAVNSSTDATILWDSTNDEFDFSHKITTPSIQTSGASTIDELTVSNDTNLSGGLDVAGDVTIADKLGHTGDSNTFFRFPSADTVTIETAGSEAFRIDNSGNLCLGNTTASAKLDIRQDSGYAIRAENSSGHYFRVNSTGAIEVAGSEVIDASRNLTNIGTISSGAITSTGALSVNSGTIDTAAVFTSSDTAVAVNFVASDNSMQIATSGTDGIIKNDGAGNFRLFNNGAEKARIDDSGRLLINTTSSLDNNALLHIKGFSSGHAGITMQDQDNTNAKTFFKQTGGATEIQTQNNTAHGIFKVTGWNGSASAEFMRVDGASGRVGIATSSPSKTLDVSGDITSSGTINAIETDANNTNGFVMGHASTNIWKNISLRRYVTESQADALGDGTFIFTTNPSSATAFPFTKFGATVIQCRDNSNSGFGIRIGSGSGRTTAFSIDNTLNATFAGQINGVGGNASAPSYIFEGNTDTGFFHPATDVIGFSTAGSERIRIHSGGSVSIGTTTSSGKLFVNGNLRVDGAYKLNGNGNVISQSGTTTSIGDVSEDDLTVLLTGYGATSKIELNDGFIPISTNGSERVRIDGSGHLFVGKTSSNSANTGVELKSGGLFSATRADSPAGIFNRTTSNGQLVQFRRNNTTVGSVFVDTSATTYNTSSDARLKDITGYARGLKVINKLNPVAFNWKADGKADEGLIAQEVQKLVPNAVNIEDDYYQMDYSKLVVHLVAGMQEQQEQIDRLQADSHTPKGLEDMSGYQDLLAVIEKLQEEVKLLKGVN